MPTRNYRDVYTLDARFPEERVRRFVDALRTLSEEFKKIKAATRSEFGFGRVFGVQQRNLIQQYTDKLLLVSQAIRQIGSAVIATVPQVSALSLELQKLSSLKVKPEVQLPGTAGAPTAGAPASRADEATSANERLRDSYARLSKESLAYFSNEATLGKVLQLNSEYVRLLYQRILELTSAQQQASTATRGIVASSRALNIELANQAASSKGITQEQAARAAAVLRNQQLEDQLRLTVEKTVNAFERENGVLQNSRQVRRDLTQLLRASGVEGEQLNVVMQKRLEILRQLDRAERTAAANRKAILLEEQALATQRAAGAVQRAIGAGTLQARDAERAVRSITAALKGYAGGAREAAVVADRLTRAFAEQRAVESGIRQTATRDRARQQAVITRELVRQVELSKLILKEDANVAAITKRTVDLIVQGNLARREGLRYIEQEVARQRELQRLGPETTGISQFAQLALLAIVTSRIEQSIRGVIDAFAEFEQQLTEVRKTASASREQMDALGIELLQLGQEVPIPAQELAQIAGVLGQVGALEAVGKSIRGFAESAREAVRLVAEVAIATDLTAEEAAKSFGQLRAVFSRDVQRIQQELTLVTGEAATVTDALRAIFGVLNEVSNATVATVGDLNSFIQNFGGVASAAGVAVEQVAALGGAIRDLGISPQVAGTALSRLFQEAQRKAETFAEVIGTTTQEWLDLFATDANEAILQFLEGLDQLSATEQARVLTSLAARQRLRNTIIKLAQATSAQAASEKTLRDRMNETRNLLVNYNSVADEAAKFSETWNASINRLKNSITAIGNAIQPLLRVIATFIDVISGIVTAVANFPIIGKAVLSLVAFGAIVAAIRLKILLVTKTLGFMKLGLADVAAAFGYTTAKTVEHTAATVADTAAVNQNADAAGRQAGAVTASGTAMVASAAKSLLSFRNLTSAVSLLAITVGSFVGGSWGSWIQGLGTAAFSVNLLWPLIVKLKVVIGSLIATMAAGSGVFAGFASTLMSLGLAGLAVLAAKIVLVGTAIAGTIGVITLAAARLRDFARGTNDSAEALESLVAASAEGRGGFFSNLVVGFARGADAVGNVAQGFLEWQEGLRESNNWLVKVSGWLLTIVGYATGINIVAQLFSLMANGTNEAYASLKALNEALIQTQTIAAQAVIPFLEGFGADQNQVALAVEAINNGLITTSRVLSNNAEVTLDFVAANKTLLEDSIKVKKELEQQGKSAADIKEIFSEEKVTAERLVEIARENNIVIRTRVDSLKREVDLADRLTQQITAQAKAQERVRIEVERTQGVLDKIIAGEKPALSIEELEKLAVTPVEDIKEPIETQIKALAGAAAALDSLLKRQDEVAKKSKVNSALFRQQIAEKRRLDDLAAQGIWTSQLEKERQLLDVRISQLIASGNQLKGEAEELENLIRLRRRLNDLARQVADRAVERQEALAAEKELERRAKLREDLDKRLQKIEEENANLRLSLEDETTQKLGRLQAEYYAKLKELEELRIEDAERAVKLRLAVEENRLLSLLALMREESEARIKARKDSIDKENKEIEAQLKNIEKGFREQIKEATQEIKGLEQQIKSAAKALDSFNKGFDAMLRDLGDPFAKLAESIEKSADAARELVANAAKTGDIQRISDALKLGAESIKKAAFEAGKSLAKLGEERKKINEEAAKLSLKDQQGLREFRQAYIRNLRDVEISEVERGRRAQVLRQRAGEVFGTEGEELATRIADVLENERQLAALRDQTELQKRLVDLSESQLAALEKFGEAAVATVGEAEPTALLDKLDELIQATKDTPVAVAIRESIQKQQDIIDRLTPIADRVQRAVQEPEPTEQQQIDKIDNLLIQQAKLAEETRRLDEATATVAGRFANMGPTLEDLRTTILSVNADLRTLGLGLEFDRVAAAAQGQAFTEREIGQKAGEIREEGIRERVREAALATKQSEQARTRMYQQTDRFLQFMVERERERAKTDADLTKRLAEVQAQVDRIDASNRTGGE